MLKISIMIYLTGRFTFTEVYLEGGPEGQSPPPPLEFDKLFNPTLLKLEG